MLDTGALIELQKWGSPLFKALNEAVADDRAILVPTPVLVEWRAGRTTANLERVMNLVQVVELDARTAKAAGLALVGVDHPICKTCRVRGGPSVVDAVVMAVADQAGDTVLSADPEDLDLLGRHFTRVVIRRW